MQNTWNELGVAILAASVDSADAAGTVAQELYFPLAHSVTRVQGDAIGAWWEPKRDHIQPSEFILTRRGRVLASTYSNSPVGRMDPDETRALIARLKELRPS
ncbi:MAG: hypothetical protein AAGG11_20565 [Pseudomonadota bacterium]